MRPLINALHPDDYADIKDGLTTIKDAVEFLIVRGAKIVIACDQRWWEYGTAMQMIMNYFPDKDFSKLDVLDVGSGWSGFGPGLNYLFNCNVTEYEPVKQYRDERVGTNSILHSQGKKGTLVHDFSLENMPAQDYDVVTCISVMEHVSKATEKECWKQLAYRVRKGGLLFIDCDVVEDNTIPHIYDEMRVMPNYTLADMKERVDMLISECGMTPIGKPEYVWNGNNVHDFNFFRVGMMKI